MKKKEIPRMKKEDIIDEDAPTILGDWRHAFKVEYHEGDYEVDDGVPPKVCVMLASDIVEATNAARVLAFSPSHIISVKELGIAYGIKYRDGVRNFEDALELIDEWH